MTVPKTMRQAWRLEDKWRNEDEASFENWFRQEGSGQLYRILCHNDEGLDDIIRELLKDAWLNGAYATGLKVT